MSRRGAFALCFAMCVYSLDRPSAQADIIGEFSTSDEGWQVVSFNNLMTDDFGIKATYTPDFRASGGSPGGYIATIDQDNGDFTFAAPAKFLGNVSEATGLRYDLIYPVGDINYQPTDVLLMGGGESLLWKRSPDIVPSPSWMTVIADFVPSSEWHVGTSHGALATAADFSNVLGHLSGLFIRGEYTTGLTEMPGLDNVELVGAATPTPEPSTLAMAAIAIVTVAIRRRCRPRA